MNERQAESEGLQFTGIYSRNKEEARARLDQERASHPGAKLKLVTVPDSKLSRGGGGKGWSIYADRVYFLQERLKDLDSSIAAHYSHEQSMLARHRKELETLLEAQEREVRERHEKTAELHRLLSVPA